MKLCRFNDHRVGVVREGKIFDVTDIVDRLPVYRHPAPRGDALIAHLHLLRSEIERLADARDPIDIASVRLLSPVANPAKIMGTPANYKAHAAEATLDSEISKFPIGGRSIEEQGLFLKSSSSLVGPGEGVAIRFPDRRTDHEAELAIIFGKEASNVDSGSAFSCVAGYALALDMTIRGPEDRSFRKSPDTYSVLGPWMTTKDEIKDPELLGFELRVNGELRQKSNTSQMIMKLADQISWASRFYTLYPGDILMTGTCEGVGPVRTGDRIEMTMDSLGEMTVLCRA